MDNRVPVKGIWLAVLFLNAASSCKQTCSCNICFKGSANCSNMDLDKIPDIPDDTVDLNLAGNRLIVLQSRVSFNQSASRVTKLDLSNNSISSVPAAASSLTPSLQELILDYNNFEKLPFDYLANVASTIQRIRINHNSVGKIISSFDTKKFTQLTLFDAIGNCFTSLDSIYVAFPKIEVLRVGGQVAPCPAVLVSEQPNNNLTLRTWGKLGIFHFGGSPGRISFVRGRFFSQLPLVLRRLHLQHVSLPWISFSDSILTHLRLENVERSSFTDVGALCATLEEMVIINSYFSMDGFHPSTLVKCVVHTVYLKNSTNIYFGLWKLFSSLRNVSIIGNSSVTGLDALTVPSFEGMRVEFLNLSLNAIAVLNTDFFRYYSSLVDLDLRSNSLTSFNGSTMNYLINLKSLDLSSNRIEFLTAKLRLGMLKYFSLSRNNLTSIPANFLTGCPNLTVLDLTYNRLTLLGSVAGIGAHRLVIVEAGNPWHCDSSLAESYRKILLNGSIDFVCLYNHSNTDASKNPILRTTDELANEFNKDDSLCLMCQTPRQWNGTEAKDFVISHASAQTTGQTETKMVNATTSILDTSASVETIFLQQFTIMIITAAAISVTILLLGIGMTVCIVKKCYVKRSDVVERALPQNYEREENRNRSRNTENSEQQNGNRENRPVTLSDWNKVEPPPVPPRSRLNAFSKLENSIVRRIVLRPNTENLLYELPMQTSRESNEDSSRQSQEEGPYNTYDQYLTSDQVNAAENPDRTILDVRNLTGLSNTTSSFYLSPMIHTREDHEGNIAQQDDPSSYYENPKD